jgi:hypothetical protein
MWKEALRADDAQALNAETPDLNPHGTNQYSGDSDKIDVTTSSDDRGTPYALARLRRDRSDIHARVLSGEISPNAGRKQVATVIKTGHELVKKAKGLGRARKFCGNTCRQAAFRAVSGQW